MSKLHLDNTMDITNEDIDHFHDSSDEQLIYEMEREDPNAGFQMTSEDGTQHSQLKFHNGKLLKEIYIDQQELENVLEYCHERRITESTRLVGDGAYGIETWNLPPSIAEAISLTYHVDFNQQDDRYAINRIIESEYPLFKCTNRRLNTGTKRR